MTGEARLLSLVDSGHDLILRERSLLRLGDIAGAAELCTGKQALLDELEQVMRSVRRTERVRAALEELIGESRRNERLILAARQGLAVARRRIDAVTATLRGAVAYDRDGAPIASRDDGVQKSSRA